MNTENQNVPNLPPIKDHRQNSGSLGKINSLKQNDQKATAKNPPLHKEGSDSKNTNDRQSALETWRFLSWGNDDHYDPLIEKDSLSKGWYHGYYISLSLHQFLAAWILHSLNFGLMGPFVGILGIFYWPYLRLMKNWAFFNPLLSSTDAAFLFWVSNIAILVAKFVFEVETINYGVLVFGIMSVLIRAGYIACKYATFTPLKWKRLTTPGEKGPSIMSEILLGGPWLMQGPKDIQDQINECYHRRYIDRESFKISFLVDISEISSKKLTDKILPELLSKKELTDEEEKIQEQLNKDLVTTQNNITWFNGNRVVYVLVNQFKNSWSSKLTILNCFLVNMVVCLPLALAPCFGRLDAGLTFCGDTVAEIVVYWATFFMSYNQFFSGYVGTFLAYRDYDRIIWCNEQVNQMLDIHKQPISDIKEFPTIRLTNQTAIDSWLSLKKIVCGYGLRFYSRHAILLQLITVFFICSLCLSLNLEWAFFWLSRIDLIIVQYVLICATTFFGLSVVVGLKKALDVNHSISYSSQTAEDLVSLIEQMSDSYEHYQDPKKITCNARKLIARAIETEQRVRDVPDTLQELKLRFERLMVSLETEKSKYQIRFFGMTVSTIYFTAVTITVLVSIFLVFVYEFNRRGFN